MIDPDEPQCWVQWDDGTWSPVYADGWTGERLPASALLAAMADRVPSGTDPGVKGVGQGSTPVDDGDGGPS